MPMNDTAAYGDQNTRKALLGGIATINPAIGGLLASLLGGGTPTPPVKSRAFLELATKNPSIIPSDGTMDYFDFREFASREENLDLGGPLLGLPGYKKPSMQSGDDHKASTPQQDQGWRKYNPFDIVGGALQGEGQ